MNNQIIGIIGGMGPQASAEFYRVLIHRARKQYGAHENNDYPEILIDSVPVPDFLSDTKNMEEAGAIATITIFTSARSFTAPGSTKFNCTIGPEGQSLIDAVQKNPNMIITISAPGAPINISTTTNIFTSIITHEMQELSRDPTYAEYITTSNPPSDNCILISQYEASDPVESFNTIEIGRAHV